MLKMMKIFGRVQGSLNMNPAYTRLATLLGVNPLAPMAAPAIAQSWSYPPCISLPRTDVAAVVDVAAAMDVAVDSSHGGWWQGR